MSILTSCCPNNEANSDVNKFPTPPTSESARNVSEKEITINTSKTHLYSEQRFSRPAHT